MGISGAKFVRACANWAETQLLRHHKLVDGVGPKNVREIRAAEKTKVTSWQKGGATEGKSPFVV
jgi:hypothetical protein